MFPEIVQNMENLSQQLHELFASMTRDNLRVINKEIINLKEKHRNLSSEVLAYQEITNCINLMTKQPDCLPILNKSICAKTASFHSKISEINSILKVCEEELFLQKSLKSLDEKDYKEAMCQCGKILANKPGHAKSRMVLSNISFEDGPQIKLDIESYLQNYKFQLLHSFGQEILSQPHHLHVSAEGKILFVSDHGNNKIHLFTVEGEYIGPSPVSIIAPAGIFGDDKNQVWICDLKKQSLIKLNQYGEEQVLIYLPDFLEKGCKTTYPCWGSYYKGMITLLLSDRDIQCFTIRRFSCDDFEEKPYKLSLSDVDFPCGLVWCKDSLLIGSKSQGCLYVSSSGTEQFIPLGKALSLNQLKAFTLVSNSVFLNYGNTLVKMNIRGEIIFSVDLSEYSGRSICLNFGIAGVVVDDRKTLFVPDGINKCIHAFSV